MATLWIQGTGQASLKPQHISFTKWGYTYFFTNGWHVLEICGTANLRSVRQELCILTLLVKIHHSAYRLESCTDYALICVPYQTYIFGAPQTSSNYSAPFFHIRGFIGFHRHWVLVRGQGSDLWGYNKYGDCCHIYCRYSTVNNTWNKDKV